MIEDGIIHRLEDQVIRVQSSELGVKRSEAVAARDLVRRTGTGTRGCLGFRPSFPSFTNH